MISSESVPLIPIKARDPLEAIAPTSFTPLIVPSSSKISSASSASSSLSVSCGIVTFTDICSLPISGIMTIPMRTICQIENTSKISAARIGTAFFRKQNVRTRLYHATNLSKIRCSLLLLLRSKVADIAGTTESATIRDAIRLYAIVRHISIINSLVRPSVKRIGRKTQIVVSVEATIAPAICFAPCTAALAAGTPCPRRR